VQLNINPVHVLTESFEVQKMGITYFKWDVILNISIFTFLNMK
jgi:hypothetical protein